MEERTLKGVEISSDSHETVLLTKLLGGRRVSDLEPSLLVRQSIAADSGILWGADLAADFHGYLYKRHKRDNDSATLPIMWITHKSNR
jgi:hypothetical protein